MKKYFTVALTLIASLSFGGQNLELLISKKEINARLTEVAAQVTRDYQGKELTVLLIMKGALCIGSDLIQKIDVPCKLECIRTSSYGYNGTSSGPFSIGNLSEKEIEGRDILIVDDILETGTTMLRVIDSIKEKNPSSVKTLLLLVKDVPRKIDYRPDYVLFDIPDRFVVGYGLDYKELCRGLPGIFAFIGDQPPF